MSSRSFRTQPLTQVQQIPERVHRSVLDSLPFFSCTVFLRRAHPELSSLEILTALPYLPVCNAYAAALSWAHMLRPDEKEGGK